MQLKPLQQESDCFIISALKLQETITKWLVEIYFAIYISNLWQIDLLTSFQFSTIWASHWKHGKWKLVTHTIKKNVREFCLQVMSWIWPSLKCFLKSNKCHKNLKKERTIVITDTHLMLRVLSLYCSVPASPGAVLFSRLWLVRGTFFCWVKNVSLLFFGQPRLSDFTNWSPILLYPVWALKISKSFKIVILIIIIIIIIMKMIMKLMIMIMPILLL